MLNVLLQILLKCNSQFKDWKPSNADETKVFVGFSIHVDAVNLPRLNDYWSSTTYSELILEAKPSAETRFLLCYNSGILR